MKSDKVLKININSKKNDYFIKTILIKNVAEKIFI